MNDFFTEYQRGSGPEEGDWESGKGEVIKRKVDRLKKTAQRARESTGKKLKEVREDLKDYDTGLFKSASRMIIDKGRERRGRRKKKKGDKKELRRKRRRDKKGQEQYEEAEGKEKKAKKGSFFRQSLVVLTALTGTILGSIHGIKKLLRMGEEKGIPEITPLDIEEDLKGRMDNFLQPGRVLPNPTRESFSNVYALAADPDFFTSTDPELMLKLRSIYPEEPDLELKLKSLNTDDEQFEFVKQYFSEKALTLWIVANSYDDAVERLASLRAVLGLYDYGKESETLLSDINKSYEEGDINKVKEIIKDAELFIKQKTSKREESSIVEKGKSEYAQLAYEVSEDVGGFGLDYLGAIETFKEEASYMTNNELLVYAIEVSEILVDVEHLKSTSVANSSLILTGMFVLQAKPLQKVIGLGTNKVNDLLIDFRLGKIGRLKDRFVWIGRLLRDVENSNVLVKKGSPDRGEINL